jgi:uncharacterized protein YfaP (DUF2135 family)
LVDKIRNIWILDANHTNAIPKSTAIDFNNQYIVKESTNNKWNNHKEAITVYSHVIKVFDYYANVLGRNGASGEHEPIQIAVNYREDNNITWSDSLSACAYSAGTLIEIGDGDDYAKALDAVGHEFTHSVNHNIWDPTYEDTEAKALNEAYADIMGELIEDGVLDLYGQDLANGAIRNFADPSNPEDSSQPSQPSNYRNLYNGILWDKAHVNSGIINHAAYLMDQNWPTSDHADELATLFYRSMYYLSSNSNFLDCRNALLAASKSMNMSYEKRKVIADALTNVGVVHEDEEAWASIHHIKGVVKDASTDKPIIDAKIIAVATSGIGGGIGYSNSTGNYDVKVNRAVYTVSIFADGYKSYRIENVDLSSWTNLTTYMDTVRLVPVSWTSNNYAFASGIITNARTGAVLEGVTVKFRNGSNNQSGSYVQIVSGIDLELQTDSAGKYYTAALPAGNYTLEASRDGYITGYANIVSGNSETCNNQNVSITSELAEGTIRIVLTWGENPRDLDSHVVGTLSNGSRFHVFYADKSKYDGSIEVCNLDIDDVTSYGPETITLNATTEYPYYYYIHRYAGTGSVATSSAKIRVFKGNKLLRTFYVPTDQGSSDYWNVFAIVDGEIIEKNTITSSPNTSYATSSRMRSIYNEDDLDIEDLPEKEPYIEEEEVTEITETEMDGEITIPETEEQSEENSEVSNDISEENSEVTNDDSEDKEVVPENPDESTEENEFAEENQTAEEIVDEENVN